MADTIEDTVKNAEEKMAKLGMMGDVDDVPIEEEKDSSQEEKPATPEETPAAEETPSDDDSTGDSQEQDDGNKEAEETTLPDAYRRSAIHQSWTTEEIDDFFKSDPEKALKTFEKIHQTNNQLSQEFSKLGQAAIKAQETPIPEATSQTPIPATKQIVDNWKDIEEGYAGEPIVGVLKNLVGEVERLNQEKVQAATVTPTPAPAPKQDKSAEHDVMAKQVNAFFADESMRSYDEFYGTPGQIKESGQITNTEKIFETADQIMAGAILQGNEMPLSTALDKAHLIVANPYHATANTNAIKISMKKRSRGIQLQPGSASSDITSETGDSTSTTTKEQIEKNARTRLKKVFG